jgi:hypothetical protein
MGLMTQRGADMGVQNEAEQGRAWISPRRAGTSWRAERRIGVQSSFWELGAAVGEV